MSAYVAETDAQAQAEAKEGVWYFLKNCLKGHLRREGRQLTFGPGIPYIPPEEFTRTSCKFSDPTTPLLGDAESWDDLQQSASIIVGSAETVYRRIMDILDAFQGRQPADPVPPRQHGRTRWRARACACSRPRWRRGCGRIRRRLFAREFPADRRARRRWRSERPHHRRPRTQGRRRRGRRRRAARLSARLRRRARRRRRPPAVPSAAGAARARDRAGASRLQRLGRARRPASIDDVVFHYLELFDALVPAALRPGRPLRRRLDRRRARGAPSGAGGAADADRRLRAVRAGRADRRRVHACAARARHRSDVRLRALLFAEPDGALAKRWFPDGRGDLDEEVRRYQMLRFGSFMGFKPPYFYHRELRERLYRALDAVAGDLGRAATAWCRRRTARPMTTDCRRRRGLRVIDGAGHAVHLEQPERVADLDRRIPRPAPGRVRRRAFEATRRHDAEEDRRWHNRHCEPCSRPPPRC